MKKYKNVPQEVLNAIIRYYLDRGDALLKKATWDVNVGCPNRGPAPAHWDKNASLKKIDEACVKHNMSFEASAGTFWLFLDYGKTHYVVATVNSDNVLGEIKQELMPNKA
jgi:hypothetical protein